MIYHKRRVMKVPLKGDVSSLIDMIRENKEATQEALKFFRPQIRHLTTIDKFSEEGKKELKESINKVNRETERRVTRNTKLIGLGSKNDTARNSFKKPIINFTRSSVTQKRPPRFRRMDIRLALKEVRINFDAPTPVVEIGFRNLDGRGVIFHPFEIQGNDRYFNRFNKDNLEQTTAYLSYQKGRIWISLVFDKKIVCPEPELFLGLDAGMYKNKNVWYPALLTREGSIVDSFALSPIDMEVEPEDAAQILIDWAQKHNACIVTENLKNLGFKLAGKKARKPFALYRNELITACEVNAVPMVQINPRNTSKTCHKCGHIHSWKKHGVVFDCKGCEFVGHADENAAINIARLGPAKYNEETK